VTRHLITELNEQVDRVEWTHSVPDTFGDGLSAESRERLNILAGLMGEIDRAKSA